MDTSAQQATVVQNTDTAELARIIATSAAKQHLGLALERPVQSVELHQLVAKSVQIGAVEVPTATYVHQERAVVNMAIVEPATPTAAKAVLQLSDFAINDGG